MTHHLTLAAARRRGGVFIGATPREARQMALDYITASAADGWMLDRITAQQDGRVIVQMHMGADDDRLPR